MPNRTIDYDPVPSYGAVHDCGTAPDYGTVQASKTQPSGADRSSFGLDDVKSYIQPVEELILKYPGPALASAFLVGVLVAWWIKRK